MRLKLLIRIRTAAVLTLLIFACPFSVWAQSRDNPQRDEWQKPDEVVQRLNLKPGDVIADIGAGRGYFTWRFAQTVGPEGKALGLEIDPRLVEEMTKEAERLTLKNYVARLVQPDDPGLEAKSVDIAFLCNAYHHLQSRADYFKRLAPALKPNGRVVIIDFYKKPLPVGPRDLHHKVSEETVKEELQKAGYRLSRSLDFLPYQYFLEFSP
jgi:predicted methyltransferase